MKSGDKRHSRVHFRSVRIMANDELILYRIEDFTFHNFVYLNSEKRDDRHRKKDSIFEV